MRKLCTSASVKLPLAVCGLMCTVQPEYFFPFGSRPHAYVYISDRCSSSRVLTENTTALAGNGKSAPSLFGAFEMPSSWARYGSAPAESLGRQARFGSGDAAGARTTRPAGAVVTAEAPRPVSTAARCCAFSSFQCPSTHPTATVPEGIAAAGPGTGVPPGTGPIASANADSAVGRSTRPSGPTRCWVRSHADGPAGAA